MAQTKDKVVTVESLAAVHTHNVDTYMTKSNPTGSGTMNIDGDGVFSGSLNVNTIFMGSNIQLVATADKLEIVFLEGWGDE